MPKNKTMANFILRNNLAGYQGGSILECFLREYPDKKGAYFESDVNNGLKLIRDGYVLTDLLPEPVQLEPLKETRQNTINAGSALDFAAYVAKKGSRFTAHEKECILSMVKLAWGA